MNQIQFDPPRPECTAEIIRVAALEFSQANPGIQEEMGTDEIAADLAKHCYRFNDGYELARNLEEYEGWDIDTITVGLLDSFDSYLSKHIKFLEEKWQQDNDIKPPFAIGTIVQCRHGGTSTGEISGISRYSVAAYEIKIPGEPENSRAIVKFEDCWLHEAESTCVGCGCIDSHACSPKICHWLHVRRDLGIGLCSNCADHFDRYKVKEKELDAQKQESKA